MISDSMFKAFLVKKCFPWKQSKRNFLQRSYPKKTFHKKRIYEIFELFKFASFSHKIHLNKLYFNFFISNITKKKKKAQVRRQFK